MTGAQSSARPRAATEPSTAGVTHIRRRLDADFTILSNRLALRPGSFVTIGLGTYLMAVPPGTVVSIEALRRDFDEGETRLSKALRELEDEGFLERVRVQGPGGRFRTETFVYNHPDLRGQRAAIVGGGSAVVGPTIVATDVPVVPGAPPVGARPAVPYAVPGVGDPMTPSAVPAGGPGTAVVRDAEPGAVAVPPAPVAVPPGATTAAPPEAVQLLAGLRLRDPRLLLSEGEVAQLAPAVGEWLRRGVGAHQIAYALTADLPDRILRRPARLLDYRLRRNIPPGVPELAPRPSPGAVRAVASAPLSVPSAAPPYVPPPASPPYAPPGAPPPVSPVALPLRNCSGCDRAFRSPHLLRCRDCTDDATAAGAGQLAVRRAG